MDEKTMINDILEQTKCKLTCYQNAISETEKDIMFHLISLLKKKYKK